MRKNVSISVFAIMLAIFTLVAFNPVAEAINPNPFFHPKYVELDGQAEQQYIHDRAVQFYQKGEIRKYTGKDGYEPDSSWNWEKVNLGGVAAEKFSPKKNGSDRVVLFFHGGGYISGMNNLYRDWAMNLGRLANAGTLYMPDYRLFPNQHPAALEDAVAVYKAILAEGITANRIILIGDSAGGHLSLGLLQQLRSQGIAMPRMVLLISPWTDANMVLPSFTRNLDKDILLGSFNPRMHERTVKMEYLPEGIDTKDPLVSPVYADFTGMPPAFIAAGSNELLLDDAVLAANYMSLAGVKTKLKVYPGPFHDWSIAMPELKETRELFRDITKFINQNE